MGRAEGERGLRCSSSDSASSPWIYRGGGQGMGRCGALVLAGAVCRGRDSRRRRSAVTPGGPPIGDTRWLYPLWFIRLHALADVFVARHGRVEVGEWAVRVVEPRPHVQLVERIQAVPVRSADGAPGHARRETWADASALDGTLGSCPPAAGPGDRTADCRDEALTVMPLYACLRLPRLAWCGARRGERVFAARAALRQRLRGARCQRAGPPARRSASDWRRDRIDRHRCSRDASRMLTGRGSRNVSRDADRADLGVVTGRGFRGLLILRERGSRASRWPRRRSVRCCCLRRFRG